MMADIKDFDLDVSRIGYARDKRTGEKIDVNCIEDGVVYGRSLDDESRRKWLLGHGHIELIEFGSFNPRNKNYRKNGNVLATL